MSSYRVKLRTAMLDHWHVPRFLLVGGVFGAAIFVAGDYVWQRRQAQNAQAAALAGQWAEATPSSEALVSGETPLAPDVGNEALVNEYTFATAVPGTSITYDPYTGALADEIDPTTGEIWIGGPPS